MVHLFCVSPKPCKTLRMELDTEQSALQHNQRRLAQWAEKVKHKEREIDNQKNEVRLVETPPPPDSSLYL